MQGGVMSNAESKKFETNEFFENSIKLRKFDEMAKKWGKIEKASSKPPSGFNIFQAGGKGGWGKLASGATTKDQATGEIKTIDWKDLKKIYKI